MASSDKLLFDRRCKLTIYNPVKDPADFKTTQTTDVIEISGGVTDDRNQPGLRITFKIIKTLKKEPNTLEIVVYNLAPSTRQSLQQKGVKVLLEAGYRETGISRYFYGDVRTVDHVRDNGDWKTTFRLGDGERSWRHARVSESFSPGSPKYNVCKRVAESLGLDMGNADKRLQQLSGNFDQGWTAHGSASREMDRLMKAVRLLWSVQDGQLQILAKGEVLDVSIPDITADSGLVGSPEMGTPAKKGEPALVKFKALLTAVQVGARVKLKSERYDGFVEVRAVEYTGDTHGGEFYSEISGVISK